MTVQSRWREMAMVVTPRMLDIGSGDRAISHYHVFLYGHTTSPHQPTLAQSDALGLRGQPLRALDDAPLIAREELTIRWPSYRDYLALVREGDALPERIRRKLLDGFADGLVKRFKDIARQSKAHHVRLWLHCESPELDELPWEMFATGPSGHRRFSLVRGRPCPAVPLVPIGDRLRIGVIGAADASGVLAALSHIRAFTDIEHFPGAARAAIQRAAQCCEVLHLVADGEITSSYSGCLRFGPEEPPLSATELDHLVFGRRATVLALSAPDEPLNIEESPTIYRAFTHLGANLLHCSLVAPIAPRRTTTGDFWGAFYQALHEKLSIEEAVRDTTVSTGPEPVAIFLRHRLGREFTRRKLDARGARSRPATAPPVPDRPSLSPGAAAAEHKILDRFLTELSALDRKLSTSSTPLTETAAFREAQALLLGIEGDLQPYFQIDEEEP
jgi:hypothetical protein